MNRNHGRLVVWVLTIGFIAGIGLGGFSQSEATQIESIDPQRQLLQNVLVGVSDASFYDHPDTASGSHPILAGTRLGRFWLPLADLAIVGFAYLQFAEEESQIALHDNLTTTLMRVGDLAADIVGTLPLIIEIGVEEMSVDPTSLFGWIFFDEESLRTAHVPDILKADDPSKRLDAYANDMAREIGLAIGADEWLFQFSPPRGYIPGVGIYLSFELDSYDSFLPANLNTAPKWQDRLTRIFGKLGDAPLSAMAEDESLIVSVEGFIGWDKTFFIIDRDDLLTPSAWEIVYWE